jgi:uncharacterized protein YdiU (UPF0061 family)
LFDLYEVISKESSKRWKKVIKEGRKLSKIKDEKNKMLQECKEEVKKHLGIEQLAENENPMEGFKDLVEILVKANTTSQQQFDHLQQEKEDMQQQRLEVNDSQKLHEQTTTILTSEYTKFKEIRQNLEETTKHATTLNSVVSNWPSYFATTYNKLRA